MGGVARAHGAGCAGAARERRRAGAGRRRRGRRRAARGRRRVNTERRPLYNRGDGARRIGWPSWSRSTPRTPRAKSARSCTGWRASCARWARATVDEVDVGDHAYVYARFGDEPPRAAAERPRRHRAGQQRATPRRRTCWSGAAIACTASAPPTPRGRSPPILEALAAGAGRAGPVGVLFSGDEERSGTCIRRVSRQRGGARASSGRSSASRPAAGSGVRHRGIGAATASLERAGRPLVAVDELGQPDRGAGARGGRARRHGRARTAARGRPASRASTSTSRRSTAASPSTSSRRARRCRSRCGRRRARASTSCSPRPSARVRAAAAPHAIAWTVVKASPPFATRDLGGLRAAPRRARRAAPSTSGSGPRRRGFSERGIDAVVFGPGDDRAGPRRRRVRRDRRAGGGARQRSRRCSR